MYGEKIYRYIFFRVGRDKQLAEDLTSDIMLKAYEHFADYDDSRKFSVWIYRIAHNKLVDFYKKAKFEQVDIEDAKDNVTTSEDFDDEFDKNLDIEKVKDIIEDLPDQQKSVIVLKFMDDMTNKEIAEIMGMNEAHIRVLQHRSIVFLRSRLSHLRS